jgi:hypothetical protein
MIRVYLENRPPLAEYLKMDVLNCLQDGEVKRIATETGNHWRKIFNVYAKLIYSLAKVSSPSILSPSLLSQYVSWQDYRDQALLREGSDTELYFGGSRLRSNLSEKAGVAVHLVMGKAFAERVLAEDISTGIEGISVEWLDKEFAINREQRVIVCPYFDYRQLSNIKIERLVGLITSLKELVDVGR